MANSDDLKSMVMSFRVSELQVLLGFAGRSKTGKKHELMGRAVSLVERGCSTPIQIKIRELYKRRFPGGTPPGKSPATSSSNSTSTTKSSSPARYTPYPSKGESSITSGQPPGYSSEKEDETEKFGNQSEYSGRSSNQIPVHPDVKFKRLPFYDILGELLKPSSLVPRNASRFQETFFIFHLTPGQAQDIVMSGDIQPNARMDYNVQIQLRFCLLETSCKQTDEFPPSICVRVNGKMAPLPNPIPTNKPGMEPKRPRRPVNITSICRISPTVSNHISVSWASELGRSYCVGVSLVRKLSANVLLTRLKQRGSKHPDHTRALIKEKLAQDPDSEIATTSLRVSLMCPLGKMRMTYPCRSSTCNHLQCFDAPTFLQMNEKKPTWQCPVCDREAEFDNLIVDGYFSEILKVTAEATEIQFSEDGQWQPMKKKEKGSSSPEPITMITGDDTPEESSSSQTTAKPAKKENIHVIDLTESDDEDMPEAIPASPGSDSTPTIITTIKPAAHNKQPPQQSSSSNNHGCVSPPLISLDSPGRLSYSSIHSPPSLSSYSPASVSSLPRSPQSVGDPRSPYPSSNFSHSSSNSSSNSSSSSTNSSFKNSPRATHSPHSTSHHHRRRSPSPPVLNQISHLPSPLPSYGYPPTPSLSSMYPPPPAHSNSRPTPPPLHQYHHRDLLHSLYGPLSGGESSSNENNGPDFDNILGFLGDLRRSPPAAHQPFSLSGSSHTAAHLSPNSNSSHSNSSSHKHYPAAASSTTYEAGYALPLTKQDRKFLRTPSPPQPSPSSSSSRPDHRTMLLDHDPLLSTP